MTERASKRIAAIDGYEYEYDKEAAERILSVERPLPKVVPIAPPHRSLREKAHDKASDFERNYPW